MNELNENRLFDWIEKLQSLGKHAFSLEQLYRELPNNSSIAIKRSLSRLTEKGKVVSISRGYYLIIPPQYSSKGILPPSLFLDTFMKYLRRPYYLALLNAAGYHGASHQQPQEFFIVTSFPVLRSTHKKGMKLNYISKKNIPTSLLIQKKTETGYLSISNPALTATDLIQFEKRIGGINRAVSVINELAETIKPEDFSADLITHVPVTVLQRLGYILEFACSRKLLSKHLFELLKNNPVKFFRTPLKVSRGASSYSPDNRWKVIVNTEIEIDE